MAELLDNPSDSSLDNPLDKLFQTRFVDYNETVKILNTQRADIYSSIYLSKYLVLLKSDKNTKIPRHQGFDMFGQYPGYTHLMIIAIFNYLPLLKSINPSIEDINLTNDQGNTALHLVLFEILKPDEPGLPKKDYYSMVGYLIERGTIIYIPNEDNITSHDLLQKVALIDSRYRQFLSNSANYYDSGYLPADIFKLVLQTLNYDEILMICASSDIITRKYYLDGNSILWKYLYSKDICEHYPMGYQSNQLESDDLDEKEFNRKISNYSIKDLYHKIFRIYRKFTELLSLRTLNKSAIKYRIRQLLQYSAEKLLIPKIEVIFKYYPLRPKNLHLQDEIIANNLNSLFISLYDHMDKSSTMIYKNYFLIKAIERNNLTIIEFLLDDGADDYTSAFTSAIQNDRVALMQFFLNLAKEKLGSKTSEFLNSNIDYAQSVGALKILFLDPDAPATNFHNALIRGLGQNNVEMIQWVVENLNPNIVATLKSIKFELYTDDIDYNIKIDKMFQYLYSKMTRSELNDMIQHNIKHYYLKNLKYMLIYLDQRHLLDRKFIQEEYQKLLKDTDHSKRQLTLDLLSRYLTDR